MPLLHEPLDKKLLPDPLQDILRVFELGHDTGVSEVGRFQPLHPRKGELLKVVYFRFSGYPAFLVLEPISDADVTQSHLSWHPGINLEHVMLAHICPPSNVLSEF